MGNVERRRGQGPTISISGTILGGILLAASVDWLTCLAFVMTYVHPKPTPVRDVQLQLTQIYLVRLAINGKSQKIYR